MFTEATPVNSKSQQILGGPIQVSFVYKSKDSLGAYSYIGLLFHFDELYARDSTMQDDHKDSFLDVFGGYKRNDIPRSFVPGERGDCFRSNMQNQQDIVPSLANVCGRVRIL
jgi:hypothetical protein